MPTPTPIVRSEIRPGRVLSNTALTPRLFALRIDGAAAPFAAGQFVRLELELDGEKVAKPYSLVNPPTDPVTEIFFNTVPGGRLSNALAALRPGDTVGVSQPPTGFFTLQETPAATTLWMFATGTGLGPYLSILRTSELWERYARVVLVHGVPTCAELVYSQVIDAVRERYAQRFDYLPCVSREACAAGFAGRLTEALHSGELERRMKTALGPEGNAVMLCGNHAMINEMQSLLKERGLRRHLRHKPGHVVNEQYF